MVFWKMDNFFQFNETTNILLVFCGIHWGQYTHQKMHISVNYPWHNVFAHCDVYNIVLSMVKGGVLF
jgi:hypothetical protein